MSKLPEQIVRELLDDNKFVDECKENLSSIMADNQFNANDMPEVLSLVVLIVEKYDTFDIDEKDIAEVLRILVIELLKKLNLLDEAKPDLEKMLDACLKLVVLKVKSKTFWSRVKKMLKKCKCC
jgi:hypothetical protein